jgi:hypothetical protein
MTYDVALYSAMLTAYPRMHFMWGKSIVTLKQVKKKGEIIDKIEGI